MRKALGIIPVRYVSQRFPGKPLAMINGRTLIEHVYKRARLSSSLSRVIIATDDERIHTKCRAFGAEVKMTSASHKTGTERASEAAEGLDFPIIISIQGDELLMDPRMIESLVTILQKKTVPMATLRKKNKELEHVHDKNIVKMVIDHEENALYFSRSPIPFSPSGFFWQHIGVYGFQKKFLMTYKDMPASSLEKSEGLEQLRALENGFKIKTVETQHPSLSVNVPADITRAEALLNKAKENNE